MLLAEDGGHFENPARGIAYRISGKTWVNNHAHVLRPKADIDIAYLCRVLENYDVTPFVTGTTRGKLTKGGASEIPIPLPPLPEQRRIAAILDKADALRTKRREALAQLDRLAQSIFVEMFGDPVTNPKGWPMVSLETRFDFKNGINFSAEQKGRGVLTVDVANMYSDDVYINTKGLYRVDVPVSQDRLLSVGDLLFVRSSVKPEGVAWPALFAGLAGCGNTQQPSPRPSGVMRYQRSTSTT
ncbi:restriction endonuclease subunit S [Ideonella dechloratans]|uniref:restriction endonuclease subunit S n=1 Tax=Ideonella dechloratans TaxID=36863 RepID=UPI0035B245DD